MVHTFNVNEDLKHVHLSLSIKISKLGKLTSGSNSLHSFVCNNIISSVTLLYWRFTECTSSSESLLQFYPCNCLKAVNFCSELIF